MDVLSNNPLDAATLAAVAAMPSYFTAAQKLRLAKIRAGRQLFKGAWRKHLLTDGRTAHLFKSLRRADGRELPLLVTVNVIGLAAKKTADLLMLDPPGIKAPEQFGAQQAAIDAINQASAIDAMLYQAALTSTYEAEAWVQVMRHNGRTILSNVPADICFPIGDVDPAGNYGAVEKVWRIAQPVAGTTIVNHYLRKERHHAGRIENELWRIGSREQIEGRAPLAAVYGPDAPPDVQDTGVDELLLDFVPNFSVAGENVSDFDNIDELVDQFTASVSQVAGVLAKHADPKVWMPEQYAADDAKGVAEINASHEAFFGEDPKAIPTYIVWQAQLDAALKMVDNWLGWLLAICEMSPGLLGLRKGGATPEAWRKLRLEAANTLAKVSRKKLFWNRFLVDRYRVAAKLDNATPGSRYDYADVLIEWHDGIPLDETEQIEDVTLQRQAGVIDRQTAVEQLNGPERAAQINDRLSAEEAAGARRTMNLQVE